MKRPAKAEQEGALVPKRNQHRQGRRGSSTPHSFSPAYAVTDDGSKKRKRDSRHFRQLAQDPAIEGLGQLFAMSEEEAEKACEKYKLVPPLDTGRCCWKCGGKMDLKIWKPTTKINTKGQRVEMPAKKILACTGQSNGQKCTIRYSAEKAYT